MVGRDLEEINGRFDHHRGEINCLKKREEELEKQEEELKGFVIGAAHEAEVFKTWLDCMEEKVCRCEQTSSEVGEDLSSEEDSRTELSYASARGSEYVAPPVENPIPIPIPAPCCPGSTTVLPPLEEITEEPTGAICDDLDALLREVDEGRVRDLQDGSSQSVVCSPPRLGSERRRRLNGIHWMCPGQERREQRAIHSCPSLYQKRFLKTSSRASGSGEPGGSSGSPPSSGLGAVNSSLLWGAQGLSSNSSG